MHSHAGKAELPFSIVTIGGAHAAKLLIKLQNVRIRLAARNLTVFTNRLNFDI